MSRSAEAAKRAAGMPVGSHSYIQGDLQQFVLEATVLRMPVFLTIYTLSRLSRVDNNNLHVIQDSIVRFPTRSDATHLLILDCDHETTD